MVIKMKNALIILLVVCSFNAIADTTGTCTSADGTNRVLMGYSDSLKALTIQGIAMIPDGKAIARSAGYTLQYLKSVSPQSNGDHHALIAYIDSLKLPIVYKSLDTEGHAIGALKVVMKCNVEGSTKEPAK